MYDQCRVEKAPRLGVFLIGLIFIGLGSESISADSQKYLRKSISHTPALWVDSNLELSFNQTWLTQELADQLTIQRFDYNQLPNASLQKLSKTVSKISALSSEALKQGLDDTVLNEMVQSLENITVQQSRITDIQKDRQQVSFSKTKGKDLGVSAEVLGQYLNSAYIYIPYITEYKQRIKSLRIETELEGGIFWYHLHQPVDGDIEFQLVAQIPQNSSSSIDIPKNKVEDYIKQKASVSELLMANLLTLDNIEDYPSYDEAVYAVASLKNNSETINQSRQSISLMDESSLKAIRGWAKSVALETKKQSFFQLKSQVINAHKGRYDILVGKSDGVSLDDGYHLMEFQRQNGQDVEVPVGFIRIVDIHDDQSTAVQWIGAYQDRGGFVKEYARTPLQVTISGMSKSGFDLKGSELRVPIQGQMTSFAQNFEDSSWGPRLEGRYFLSKWGAAQTSFDFGIGLTFVNHDLINNFTGNSYIVSGFAGLKKRLWYRRHALVLGGGISHDAFFFQGTNLSTDVDFDMTSTGLGAVVGYAFLLTPDLSFTASLVIPFHKKIHSVKYKVGFDDTVTIDSPSDSGYNSSSLGGSSAQIGITYHLPSFWNGFSI